MGKVRFPNVSTPLGLGVGFDMPWGSPAGFLFSPRESVSPFTTKCIQNYREDYNYYFFSYQPKNRARPDPSSYYEAYDSLVEEWPAYRARALHHTQLNLGTLETRQDRPALVRFTNTLINRYGLSWVNEDLGLWNLGGKTLPYPLPPFLTREGLAACIANTRYFQENLDAPLLIEFPGFSEGVSIVLGELDALSYFATVARETGSPVTLDTGHILAYQWITGKRGADLLQGLENLPLDHCFGIHLSGCKIINDKFLDLHHGVLLDEQLILLDYLLENSPSVRAVTYEDPKFTEEGMLIPNAVPNYYRLKERVSQWTQTR